MGDRDGTIAFYSSSTDPGGLTGSTDPSWGGHERQDVRVVRLSALLREPVDFLKLDVEGAEYEIVADLISTGAIQWVLETVIEYHELPHTDERRGPPRNGARSGWIRSSRSSQPIPRSGTGSFAPGAQRQLLRRNEAPAVQLPAAVEHQSNGFG